jgi:hypothetical protein
MTYCTKNPGIPSFFNMSFCFLIFISLVLDSDTVKSMYIHSAVQRFPDWIFYRFPTNVIYRAAIEQRSWNSFSQEYTLALV